MGFTFVHKDKSVGSGVRRIAQSEFDKALEQVSDPGKDIVTAVHEARRCCKRLRGLLRLVGPVLDDSQRENTAIRDAAAHLAHARDAIVLNHTLDRIESRTRSTFPRLRERLSERSAAAGDGRSDAAAIAAFRQAMQGARERSRDWSLDKDGFEALEKGLVRTYRAMRRGLAVAHGEPTAEHLHEWRKQVKYHGFHMSLLGAIAPAAGAARRQAIDALASLLGEHHDLALLIGVVEQEAGALPGREVNEVLDAARKRQLVLEKRAFAMGRDLAAQKPKAFGKALAASWAF